MSTTPTRTAPPAASHAIDLVPPPHHTGPDFPVLDALRAVGALCVLTTHTAFWSGDYFRLGSWGTVLARLDVGVAVFFVLSGFLLARPWLAATADGRTRPRTSSYLRKRFFRIAPLYVVTVVLALGLIGADRGLSWGERVRTLFMLNTFTDRAIPAGLTQMWSLAVEVTFYLLLPLLMLALLGRRPRPGAAGSRRRREGLRVPRVLLGLAAMVAVSVWWIADGSVRAGRLDQGQPLQWLPSYLSWFAVGIALALAQVLHERGRAPRVVRPLVALARQPGSCWTFVAGLMLVLATPVGGPVGLAAPTISQALTKSLVYALVGGLVVLTGVFPQPGSGYSVVCSHPLIRRLGWLSFGVFCLHLPVLHFVMWSTSSQLFDTPLLKLWPMVVVLSLLVAELAYRLVERPGLRLNTILGNRGRRGNRGIRGRRGSTRSAAQQSTATSGTIATSEVHASSPAQPDVPPHGRQA